VKVFDLLFVNLRAFPANTLKHAKRPFKQRPAPAVDYRREYAKLGRALQLSVNPSAPQAPLSP
jgi:hypothetical protein